MRTILTTIVFVLALFVGLWLGNARTGNVLAGLDTSRVTLAGAIWHENGIEMRRQHTNWRGLLALNGEPGIWYGYGDGSEHWAERFGWPASLTAWGEIRLRDARTNAIYGYIWVFRTPDWPDHAAVFAFRDTTPGADGNHHNFTWFGRVAWCDLAPWFTGGQAPWWMRR